MNALILKENGKLEFSQAPEPAPRDDRPILVKVAFAGICGSDIPRAFEAQAYHYPLIMGHEFSAVVEESPDSSRFRRGDKVAVFPLFPCKKCAPCRSGDYAQCTDYDYAGSRSDGAFAEYVRVPEENLFPIPDGVDSSHAAMAEPCAVAYHGVRKLDIRPEGAAVVFGGGPIGNIAAQWLRVGGCGTILVADVDERKLEIAETMGFTGIHAGREDPIEYINEYTKGNGADFVVEACGLPLTYSQSVNAAARFGQVLFMGNITGALCLGKKEVSDILRREITIRGTWNSKIVPKGNDDWTISLAHMRGPIDVAPLISHTPALKEGVEIFNRMHQKTEFFNKVIFDVGN